MLAIQWEFMQTLAFAQERKSHIGTYSKRVARNHSYEKAQISVEFRGKMSAAGVGDAASKRILPRNSPKDGSFHGALTLNSRYLSRGVTEIVFFLDNYGPVV